MMSESRKRKKKNEYLLRHEGLIECIYILASLIDIVKHEQGHFDAESILFLDLNSRSKRTNCML